MDDDTFPENDESDEQTSETRKKTKKKKSGAKGNWNSHTLDNFVNIIANDEYFKDRLIFRNT